MQLKFLQLLFSLLLLATAASASIRIKYTEPKKPCKVYETPTGDSDAEGQWNYKCTKRSAQAKPSWQSNG